MKKVSLGVDEKNDNLVIFPFQETLENNQAMTFVNSFKEPLTVVFEAAHPFTFSQSFIPLPESQSVSFRLPAQTNFLYSVKSTSRPRTRLAIMTVIQPQEDCGTDTKNRRDGSLPVSSEDPAIQAITIEIRMEENQLKINPPVVSAHSGQTITFSNNLKLPLKIVFQPATPFQDGVLKDDVTKDHDRLRIIAEELTFEYEVVLDVDISIAQPVLGILKVKT